MPLRPCYRASCDHPGCRASEMVPHARTGPARSQLRSLGWTLVRWRVTKYKLGAYVGGGGKMLVLCRKHGKWRPRHGKEFPLARPPVPFEQQLKRRGSTR